MVISTEFDHFWSLNQSAEGGHKGGGRCEVSVIPYPLIFLKACIVMYMVLNGHHGVLLSKLTI